MNRYNKPVRTVAPESTLGRVRAAWGNHNNRFQPSLAEFRQKTMDLMTPKQLNSPKALKRTLNEHAYNSAEYIEISMQSFLEYLKDYTSLTLVQFAEEQGFIKHSMKMEKPVREMIDAALKQIAANRKKSAKSKTKKALEEIPDIEKESEKKTVSAKSAKKKIAKVLPTSKKYKKHMDEKFGITKKEKSKNDK